MEPIKDLSNAHLEHAISLANHAHSCQSDFSGQPYILHPLRVMAAVGINAPNYVKVAAVLHDIVEDTHIKIDDIESFYGREVRHIVWALTRDRNMSYDIYIKNQIMNGPPEARLIKRFDLIDNCYRPAPVDKDHLKKQYLDALSILDGVTYSRHNRAEKEKWERECMDRQMEAERQGEI